MDAQVRDRDAAPPLIGIEPAPISPPARAATPPAAWTPGDVSESTTLLLAIQRAAADPTVDIDRMLRLYDLYKDIQGRNAKTAYYAAFAKMQPELPIIDENGAITNNSGEVQSTYALWEDVNEAILPVLSRHGFGISFRIGRGRDNVPAVTGVLSHEGGHTEETTIELPFDSTGSKNAVQAIGSSTSYGKRYTASALLNLSSRNRQEDDDGQAAGGNGLSAVANGAISTVNLCTTPEEMRAWKTKNMSVIESLDRKESDAVVRHFNARFNRIKAGEAVVKGEPVAEEV